jgi:outer membrane protein OmpA-like peptidoglycan-associated protein
VILSLLALAHAGSTFDAHGFHLVGFTDDPRDALQMALPETFARGSYYAGVVGEYADAPLVLVRPNGEIERLLDNVVAFNLSGGWAPTTRVRIDVSAPAFASSTGLDGGNGFTIGDARVGANLVLVDGTFGLSFVPFVDLPIGNSAAYLGHGTFSASGQVAARLNTDRVYAGAAVGPSFVPTIDLGNLRGVDRLLVGAQVGTWVASNTALNAELRAEVPFASNEVAGTDTPAEVSVYGRHRLDSGGHLLVGGALPVSPGASAAAYRIFVGGGFGTTSRPPAPPPPPPLGALLIDVRMHGQLVSGAELVVTGSKPLTGQSAPAAIRHGDLQPGDRYTAKASLGCYAGTGEAVVPEGEGPLVVELVPDLAARVRLEVYDADGAPLNGAVVSWKRELTGCVPEQALKLGSTHQGSMSVGVGQHTVEVTVDGYHLHEQVVELARGDDKLIVVRLAPQRVRVTAERLEILDKVFFEFDGDQIDARSIPLLDEVASTLLGHPEILLVEVGGHTDAKGSDTYNQGLSQRRVDSVRRHLIGKGVQESRLVAKGYGESKPIADNATPEGRASNRRVEFTIVTRDESVPVQVKTIDEATGADREKAGHQQQNAPTESKIDTR